jgi:putative hemolysin
MVPDRDFATVAGFVLAILRKLPDEGEQFVEQGWSFRGSRSGRDGGSTS